MNNLNRVIINGNLTTDCKLEYGKSGTAYGGFCIAVNRSVKNGDNWEETTSFFEVKAFGKLFESQHPYLKKGTNVTVDGSLIHFILDQERKRVEMVHQSLRKYLMIILNRKIRCRQVTSFKRTFLSDIHFNEKSPPNNRWEN